ncbi:RNA degradosome polyphosphate kinase [Acetobacterium woodii]|uniref:Polyphosphate kinase n=1 Tax=Acetobacterium woodii (strain ATCC 29683 / DSM 1030 / JCM 2381 / KCTC 1655 / WB1) TaxID=931626 RepID=H6LCQ8_ACEWD|nr:RNA degradosome polyphosphate kinase [Acetobacterium woodii]AFA49045.1 polyphosphate kinase Ppk [Acetobacterium woodii DSM 1030]
MKNKLLINREISWLDFNYRVLEEAYDKCNLVMDRLKFLAITASNLDEFFMVRVAGIMDQINVGYSKKSMDGLTPLEQLAAINSLTQEMMARQYTCLSKSILPELNQNNIFFLDYDELDDEGKDFALHYFRHECYPVLTPQAIDSSRPFPLVKNNQVYLCIMLHDTEAKVKDEKDFMAILEIPKVLERIIALPKPNESDVYNYIFVENLISPFVHELFTGYEVKQVNEFRITRNGDLAIDEDEAEDLLIEIEKSIQQRKWGASIKLEVTKEMSKKMKKWLMNELEIKENELYELKGNLDLTCYMKFQNRHEFNELREPRYTPLISDEFYEKEDIFEVIREKDRLLHHPYQSFQTVVDFVKTASKDVDVLAIKQTLYRVSGDSPIIEALIQAAQNGKQVTVLVELKARFDEANNIVWAKKLEQAGCHVIYGLAGLKIHCKMILVVRKESDGIRRYVHLGTGNYNDVTAGLYTDLGMFTAKENYGSDVTTLFNLLSGYSHYTLWKKIEVAPKTLRNAFYIAIDREIENVKMGEKGKIIAKMNSLVDEGIVNKLYEASQAGVEIRLIVRGMCSLIPGLPDISENIVVHSIVGTFLEHSRIYYFYNQGKEDIYLSSADWMERNLNRRIETLFPVEDESLKKRLKDILDITLRDTIKTRVMTATGAYIRIDKRGKELLSCQEYFCKKAEDEFAAVKEKAILNRNIGGVR